MHSLTGQVISLVLHDASLNWLMIESSEQHWEPQHAPPLASASLDRDSLST
jgi:hypothetical protein